MKTRPETEAAKCILHEQKKRGLAVANRDFSRCQIFQYKGRNIAATLARRKKINFNLHGDF